MPRASLNGAEIYYETAGHGPALVMVHAGIATAEMWDPQFEHFARTHRVIRYDLRGYGRTTAPPMEYSNREDLKQLLDYLGVESAAIMGCSMGGSLSLDFTLEYPSRVTALILIASGVSGYEAPPEVKAQYAEQDAVWESGDFPRLIEMELKMWVDRPQRTPDEVNPAIREKVRAWETETLKINTDGYKPQRLAPPALERLAQVHVPTRIIVGDGDQPDIIEQAGILARGIPGARLIELPAVAHLPNLEAPGDVNQLIQSFLGD